ncbi:amidase [Rhodococcus sp. NBC_00297]|uniref:amidase n=1 Tax=Rhodococcus sp. NBC_00297 TaxID=2976005 RepID=UPI002E27B673|nr:amidase [Rhodococcus sp. NBC_00297]
MSDDLTWLPAWRIAALIAAREVTAVDVTKHFLRRIAALDPSLHSFSYLDEAGAMEQAGRAAEAVESGQRLGPLHGIPFAVMDLTRVKGMPTAGDSTPSRWDSVAVERLRDAGAVVFGTLNTYFFEADTRPRNVWDLNRDPGNSSRGSATAVAAGMLPFALAEDGAGSTRLPASWNGVLGLHPTRGLIPRIDHDNPAQMNAHGASVGPIARDVRDCAIITNALAGPDGRDQTVIQSTPRNYIADLDRGVSDLRIAWTDDFGWSGIHASEETPKVTSIARGAAFELASLGATVRPTPEVWEDPLPANGTFGRLIVSSGFILALAGDQAQARQDRLDRALGLEPAEAPMVPEFTSPTADEVAAACDLRDRLWRTTMRALEQDDIIASPTTLILPKTLEEWGLQGREFIFSSYSAHTSMFNLLGFPALTVPCGFEEGLPVGLQLATRPGREDLLFRAAKSYLDAFPQRSQPPVATTAALDPTRSFSPAR